MVMTALGTAEFSLGFFFEVFLEAPNTSVLRCPDLSSVISVFPASSSL